MLNFIKKFLNLTYYISEIDQFLMNFDKTHPRLSASQRAEKEKYARIYKLRDQPVQSTNTSTFLDNF